MIWCLCTHRDDQHAGRTGLCFECHCDVFEEDVLYEPLAALPKTARADLVSYIYGLMDEATKLYLKREHDRKQRDPEGRYVTFLDAFVAEYVGDRLAERIPGTIEQRLDALKDIMLGGDASFDLIAKVQVWASTFWGALTAHDVLRAAASRAVPGPQEPSVSPELYEQMLASARGGIVGDPFMAGKELVDLRLEVARLRRAASRAVPGAPSAAMIEALEMCERVLGSFVRNRTGHELGIAAALERVRAALGTSGEPSCVG